MNRKNFIKKCGFACLGTGVATALLQSCSPARTVNANISGDNLIVPLSDFISAEDENRFKKQVVIQHEILKYPIIVYRHSEKEYSALWMRCTHQGTELQAFGDILQCPAHGSEFNNKGVVQNGPANFKLRTFPVTVSNNQLFISLKAV